MTETEKVVVLSKALQIIRGKGCKRFISGNCFRDPQLSRTSRYTANRWCVSCIAAEALETCK